MEELAFFVFLKQPMFTFNKKERLKSRKVIEGLFTEGKSFLVYPIKVIYLQTDTREGFPVQAAFSVSKKNYRKAAQRNLVKRRLKEAYRLQKAGFYKHLGDTKLTVMFVYVAKEILPYSEFEKAMKTILNKLSKQRITDKFREPLKGG